MRGRECDRAAAIGATRGSVHVERRGYNNQRKRNINQLLPGTIQANPGSTPTPFGRFAAWHHRPGGEYRTDGDDALQISANRRLSAACSSVSAIPFAESRQRIENEPANATTTRLLGPLDLDRPHVLVANAIYELPAPPDHAWSCGARRMVRGNLSGAVRRAFLRPPGRGLRRNRPGSGDQFWNQIGIRIKSRTEFTDSAVVQPTHSRNPPWDLGPAPHGFAPTRLRNGIFRSADPSDEPSSSTSGEAFNVLNHPTLGGANSNPISSPPAGDEQDGQSHGQFVVQYRF
jgi:hypothetical protein